MHCLVTSSTVKLVSPSETIDVQYCSDHFEKNGRQKPKLNVPKLPIGIQDLRALIKGGFKSNDLKIQHVIAYLQHVASNFKGELQENWESFGVKIGNRGDTINPLDLVDVTYYDDKLIDGVKSNDASEADDIWMTFACLSIYRLARTQNVQHRSNLLMRINTQLASFSSNALKLTDNVSLYNSWVSNFNYTKLIASFDMFFYKFKDHEYSLMRFGTIPSRWKDCGAITSLSHLKNLTGMDLEEIVTWIFVPSIGKEICRMMKAGQELDKADSYVPYLMDFGLSMKSPYSSTANAGLYTWIHMIGSIMHSQRSINARMVNENELPNIRISAMLTAYVKFNKGSLMRVFVKEADKHLYEKDEGEDDGENSSDYLDLTQHPTSDSADDWFNWLEMNNFTLDDDIKDAIARECKKIQNARSGTIGSYIQGTLG
ncbi:nucleoprotein [Sweetwater Branch virus]|uniref:Nucleoprotein n=1 Tax=Sweetwater Branch virus TaxID=1272958 RepID=A0A0D3R1P4_9RHAB|nr:nucleoprotein [Sweetwater Branch virus]AJR28390.1 nucleoprotein [Sweetwater Branch virus]